MDHNYYSRRRLLSFIHSFTNHLSSSVGGNQCLILYKAITLHTIVKKDSIPTGTTVKTKISYLFHH